MSYGSRLTILRTAVMLLLCGVVGGADGDDMHALELRCAIGAETGPSSSWSDAPAASTSAVTLASLRLGVTTPSFSVDVASTRLGALVTDANYRESGHLFVPVDTSYSIGASITHALWRVTFGNIGSGNVYMDANGQSFAPGDAYDAEIYRYAIHIGRPIPRFIPLQGDSGADFGFLPTLEVQHAANFFEVDSSNPNVTRYRLNDDMFGVGVGLSAGWAYAIRMSNISSGFVMARGSVMAGSVYSSMGGGYTFGYDYRVTSGLSLRGYYGGYFEPSYVDFEDNITSFYQEFGIQATGYF